MGDGEWFECPRCWGTGRIRDYAHVADGRCFACAGKGEIPERKLLSVSRRSTFTARPEDPEYTNEVAALSGFGTEFGRATFASLEELRDRDYIRYREAVKDICAGKGNDVARMLRDWVAGHLKAQPALDGSPDCNGPARGQARRLPKG